jgi:polyhydroxyalkanoate synthesis regulator phasin
MSEVSEVLKKTLAFGMGVAAITTDRMRQFVDEAVQRGEMSREEAKKFMEDVSSRAEEERKGMQNWMREQMTRMVEASGAATAARVALLEARIDALEKRLGDVPPIEPVEQGPPTVETT